jgi:Ni/Fe-hydrogenase subunit HybB-like protein
MSVNPAPVQRAFWTPGVFVMLVFMGAGFLALLLRYTGGLGAATNLDNAYPWGIWIGIDVASGVALAAGGFTTAFLAHILGRRAYEVVARPALLTAALGYSFVSLGVFVDIGRSWAIWKPLFFQNHNSALFEVALCVMTYLTVLWIEFVPVLAERYGKKILLLATINRYVSASIGIFIILGVVLSCMHQSSLGTLLVVAPSKIHPFWRTTWQPLLFLLSAFAVGYPMVIIETGLATSSLKLESEMPVLSKLSRFTIVTLGLYLAVKIGDLLARGAFSQVTALNGLTVSFLLELVIGGILPFLLLLFQRVRNSRGGLFFAAACVVFGVVLNRFNVFVVSFQPPYAQHSYYPALGELLVTVGFIATIFFLYRVAVTYLPVLSAKKIEEVAS